MIDNFEMPTVGYDDQYDDRDGGDCINDDEYQHPNGDNVEGSDEDQES